MKTKAAILVVLLSFLLIVVAEVGIARELHVPGDYVSIQEAVDAAVEGDVIVIAPGRYYETFVIKNKLNLTIRADAIIPEELQGWQRADAIAGIVTIIGEIFLVETNENILIEGLTIIGVGRGLVLRGDNSNITVRYCIVVGNLRDGILLLHTYSNIVIECSIVSANREDGIDLAGLGTDIHIYKNNISDNGSVGIRIGVDNIGVLIEGNVIQRNFFAGIHPA